MNGATSFVREDAYSLEVRSEIREAANEHGYRIGPDEASGWLFFRSATAPAEIAIAATSAGIAGPFCLSVFHPGAARELGRVRAVEAAKGAAAAFVLASRAELRSAISEVYRLSVSLPTFPLEVFRSLTADLGDTEIERLQRVRIGQDCFRNAQLSYWNRCCPLTGISEPELLRASHIIPWARCESDAERLDVNNGFLLSSLWDAAFDSGLISFEDDGALLLSTSLSAEARRALGVTTSVRLPVSEERKPRLQWHRDNLFLSD